ncbi:hypothetical protein CONPUDRAFT_75528 [Coniophora puteana RWD-64-598 SS2]|uniref:Uncharacterized protein n=1 Tax=Coniophora puteana (strain RWD-64-598) TaxID=741705 RepID=A0A5M3MFM8_CONPW|nr:uncharacterized protein CONPUDRAFT_75528 [Coniophora puteana RWD-64-598 SS2]EIW77720.1 hypothetical protein CONPUDRAFT_75528 [Coniophora puteana RWD-64-598 SS2]
MPPTSESNTTEDFFSDLQVGKWTSAAIEARREWDRLRVQEQLSGYKTQQAVVIREQLRNDENRRKGEPLRPVVFVDELVCLTATLSYADWDDMDNDDHFRLWTVRGCEDATYHLESLTMQLVSDRTPFELGSLEFLRWQLAIERGVEEGKFVLEELKYTVNCLLGYHNRIHRVQHALRQLVGDDSTEWRETDRVGCLMTNYMMLYCRTRNSTIEAFLVLDT